MGDPKETGRQQREIQEARGATPQPVAQVTRDGSIESLHRGSIAVVDRTGRLLSYWGDCDFQTIMRSCAKPFQAVPLIETGAADHFGLLDEEIATATGSISGQDAHVDTVRSILEKIGLSESSLQCGTHRPFHVPTAKRLDREGEKAGPLRNSCAGKHACMLATCVVERWPVDTYMEVDHPLQRRVLEKVSGSTGVPEDHIPISTDGCGLPTFQVPLRNLALSFARLSDSEDSHVSRLMDCARRHPWMVAGDDRICTDLLEVTRGRVFGKIGGEAVYGMCVFEQGWGIGIKIEDGNLRGLMPVVVEVLKKLDILAEEELTALERYHYPKVTNYRREVVGRVEPTFDLQRVDDPI
jgi:L-asparaginase II